MAQRIIDELGDQLGLSRSFVTDIKTRGQQAVIDQVDTLDETEAGNLGRFLGAIQQYGMWLEGRMAEKGLVAPGREGDVLSFAGDLLGLQGEHAVNLGGDVLDAYEMVVQRMARGEQDGGIHRETDDTAAV